MRMRMIGNGDGDGGEDLWRLVMRMMIGVEDLVMRIGDEDMVMRRRIGEDW